MNWNERCKEMAYQTEKLSHNLQDNRASLDYELFNHVELSSSDDDDDDDDSEGTLTSNAKFIFGQEYSSSFSAVVNDGDDDAHMDDGFFGDVLVSGDFCVDSFVGCCGSSSSNNANKSSFVTFVSSSIGSFFFMTSSIEPLLVT